MRLLRLVLPALALVVSVAWANQAMACDKEKATAAAASKSAACTAEMASKCTPEMMAACKAKSARAAAAHCPGMLGVAMAASADHCAAGTAAATATATASDHCAGKAKATAAVAASASGKATASSPYACAGRNQATAVVAGAGQCSGHSSSSAKAAHGDCDACADMALCDEELVGVGARTQAVLLKNGVMFVHTAESPGKVNAVQSALARRTERLNQVINAGDKARLCPECKSTRGAMASGKLNREVINIEGGVLTLVTSNDRAMVAKIHAMVDANKVAARKS